MLHSRLARVSEQIKADLGQIIDRKLTDPNVPPFVTVHSVRVAKDLRLASVQVTFLQDEGPEEIERAIEALNHAASFIRSELAKQVRLKYLPKLQFFYNGSTRYAAGISEIFTEIENETPGENREDLDS